MHLWLLVATFFLGAPAGAGAADGDEASGAKVINPKRGPRPEPTAEEVESKPAAKPMPPEQRPAAPEVDVGLWGDDSSRLPRAEPPGVVKVGARRSAAPLIGWSDALAEPSFEDRHHRLPWTPRPANFGATLLPGEHFKYDVYFGGNPTGIAEAAVVLREPGANGGPDRIRLEGSARTSGVAALLTTIVYDMAAYLDAVTGAPLQTGSITKREGLSTTYKRREITTTFFGRGFVEIADDKDGKSSTTRRRLPVDTFDPLSIMAWVRSLDLENGGKAKAYGLDGTTLLRVDIISRGPIRMTDMPPLAAALGIAPDQVLAFDGTITRVDRHGAAIPGKKAYKMRFWVSNEGRRIPLMIESDLWLGVVRLILTQYDPPHELAASRPAGPKGASPGR
jgi:hypothetical protein